MKKTKLGTNTNLIRGGLNRSQFNETSEALFLTSGFVYDSAEQAEAIFKGSKKGFQYTRYSNPTVEIFEKRLALLMVLRTVLQQQAEWLLFFFH